jgi:hypothetical protein
MKNTIQTFERLTNTKKGQFIALAVLYLSSILFVYFFYGLRAYGPVHLNDEVIYFKTALSLLNGGFDIKAFHHFPPLYPISLLPAFLIFYPNNIYSAIKLLNAVYIGSVIFPVYLILRNFLKNKEIFIALFIFILNPINLVFPRSVLSENIFYPLLMWAIYFTLFRSPGKSQIKDRFEDLFLGVLYSALIFTRFIAIAVVPGLFLIWLVKQLSVEKISIKQVFHLLPRILIVILPIAISAGIWLYSGSINGVSAKEVFGFSITGNPNPLQTTPYRLLIWTVFYLVYACLMLGPGFIFFLFSTFHIKDLKIDPKYYQWFFACLIICGAFLIASIEHSWSAHYNFPDPVRIQGRYIIYITPLFFITSLIFIERSDKFSSGLFQRISAAVISCFLLLFSYLVLFKGILFIDKPLSIANSSPDGFIFGLLGYLYLLIILVFTLLYLIFYKKTKVLFGIFCAINLVIALSGNILIYKDILYPRQGDNTLIIKFINYLEKNKENSSNIRDIPIAISVPGFTVERELGNWQNTLLFIGFDNVVFEINNSLEDEPKIIFQTIFNNQTFYLKSFLKSEYTCGENACEKFIISNRKYAVIKIK